jgi:hypothetical protein
MVKETVKVIRKSKRFVTAFAILALLSSVFTPAASANESDGSAGSTFTGIDVSAISIDETETEINTKVTESDETIILDGIPSGGTSVGVDIETFNDLPQLSQFSNSGSLLRSAADGLNDDPNYAYWLNPNTGYQESLSPQGASRWFATQISAAAKLTTLLDMPSGVDFDLQIYKLTGSTLNMVGASSAGAGIREVSKYMAAAGTYYIRVLAYSGTGTFQLYNLAAYGYDSYELNDTAATATQLASLVTSTNVSVTGNIDDYYDEDYYQVTVPSGTTYIVLVLATENSNYNIYYNNDLLPRNTPFLVSAGTSAFSFPIRVVSDNLSFDEDVPYTLAIQKMPASYDPSLSLLLTTPDNSVTVQYNENATDEMYVNGHQITWWFEDSFAYPSNPSGSITRQVNLFQLEDIPVVPRLGPGFGNMYAPLPIYYESSHRGTYQNMFMVTVDNCMVNNSSWGHGAYETSVSNFTDYTATVIVNPASGHIYDILTPNIIYQITPEELDIEEKTHWYFAPPF